MEEVEEETKSQNIRNTKSLGRSQSLPFLFPQQSNDQSGSANKTLASQHHRDIQAMHDQHIQNLQAVQDQQDYLMSNQKREMKEAEKKNARMITRLDKVIECMDNHIKYQKMELRQHERCQQEKEKRDMEMKEMKDKKDIEVKEMREMKDHEMKEMRAVHDAKVTKLEKDIKALQQENIFSCCRNLFSCCRNLSAREQVSAAR